MRILYFGDVVGKSGREALLREAPGLRARLGADFVIACGENAAHGFGITPKYCADFYEAGIDCLTLGNHSFDNKEVLPHIDGDARLLRPLNYPPGTPGRGLGEFRLADGRKIVVLQVMGRVFMDPMDDPFAAAASALARYPLGGSAQAIFVDIHADATSEKMALGQFCDGKASAAIGSHSHVPTADAQILPGGTAYQTDAGMCGDYDSVIGMDKAEPLQRFTRKIARSRFEPANGEATVCGVLIETDDRNGLARRIAPLRMGGRLRPELPDFGPGP
ncbi:MAG: YmdB family metallophosphoesterase [Alphaproteobacteria bacterium]|nr:YmdB family metallophosphoesterase [Alphaproteobacteria bacterium]